MAVKESLIGWESVGKVRGVRRESPYDICTFDLYIKEILGTIFIKAIDAKGNEYHAVKIGEGQYDANYYRFNFNL